MGYRLNLQALGIPVDKTDLPVYKGHISVGADAAVDATGPFLSTLQGLLGEGSTNDTVSIYENFTGTPSSFNNALEIKYQMDAGSSDATIFGGIENTIKTASGYSGNIFIGYGVYNTFAHSGSGTVTSGYANPAQIVNGGIMTTAYGVYSSIVNTGTITTAYGLYVDAITNSGTVTTNYGVYIAGQTGGSTNYSLYLASTAGTAAGGITFGADTNLYRSAADVLKTDDSFYANTKIRAYAATDDEGFELYDQSNALIFAAIQKGTDAARIRLYDGGTVRVQLAGAQSTGSYIKNTGGLTIGGSAAAPTSGLKVIGVSYFADGTAAAPSQAYTSDTDTGTYSGGTNKYNIAAGGVAQLSVSDATSSPYFYNQLAPSSRTISSPYGSNKSFLGVDGTYTLSGSSTEILPVGYNFQPTAVFAGDGFGFGSGFLFWNHMLIQNNSGSTRTIGGIGSYIDQVTIQANGGSLTGAFHVGFLGQPTFNRINSGTLTITTLGVIEFWSNAPVVGAGTTISSITHFLATGITNSGTVTTQVGFATSGITAATNNTDILIGTATTGNWGIYQSTTTTNRFGGAVNKAYSEYDSSITNIDSGDSPYTVVAGDRHIRVDTSAGAVVINAPAATGSGRLLDVKVIDATNTTTFTCDGTDTVDGAATDVLSTVYENKAYQDAASGEWDIK